MSDDRQSAGFVRLGAGGASHVALPLARRRLLAVESAWHRVAGVVLAHKTRVVRVRRGAMEVEAVDPTWRGALLRLAPELGARLAREHPALGIRTVEVVDARIG